MRFGGDTAVHALALWCLLSLPISSRAGLPEPDVLYYGALTLDGTVQTASSGHLVELEDGGERLAAYTMGELPDAGDLYVLRVKIESPAGGPIPEGVGQLGDEATVLVNGIAAGRVHIGSRGRVTRMDLGAVSDPADVPDQDADGTPDFLDVCKFSASQLDTDGDGIGDACDPNPNDRTVSSAGLTFAAVGNEGNTPDADTGKGAVPYSFEISDTEVTNGDYLEFLHAVAASDPNGLYNGDMASDPHGGIVREGSSGTYTYRVKPNMVDKPVAFVSWLDAARYVNWLKNGSPSGGQDATTTESGAIDLAGANPEVNATLGSRDGASLPTESEWYKAAYFDPVTDSYWDYPTGSDAPPVLAQANGVGDVTNQGMNVANYDSGASWNGQTGNVTTVAGTTSASPFGTLDQGGNVSEWLAEHASDSKRFVRGGSFRDASTLLIRTSGESDPADLQRDPFYEGPDLGIRIVQFECDLANDTDCDGSLDGDDNCLFVANVDQADTDGDGRGNACECGDFSGDGRVNTTDARLIQRCSVGAFACVALGDVTGDGLVNTSDARIIQRFSVGEFGKDTLQCCHLQDGCS